MDYPEGCFIFGFFNTGNNLDHVPRIQFMKDSQAFDFDGEYGRGYDELARQVIPAYEQIFRATAALFENELPSDARVLVVGSGTGTEVATFGAPPGALQAPHVALHHGLPFAVKVPNAGTIAALRQARTGEGLTEYTSLEDLKARHG